MKFAIYYAGDAYSTHNKIMGRQSAGKSFMKGVARKWPTATISALGPTANTVQSMANQLRADGQKGQVQWSTLPDFSTVNRQGVLYYPAPPSKEIAAARNLISPNSFSLMGVTHTLSSDGAMDQIAALLLPPFKPWDCLICTSRAAKTLVENLHDEMRAFWETTIGATRLNTPHLPVIPLGVNCSDFDSTESEKATARREFGIEAGYTAFLFSGRLSFHAKANPAPMYMALEAAAKTGLKLCLIEAGLHPNDAIKSGFEAAQRKLAPSVKFIHVPGNDDNRYRQAWLAADCFISISDNIQETFGLTPVEAMASGLPVIVSDWNGYKDTVRDGIDGFRIPTLLPPPETGNDLALRHALGLDTYDMYIGRTSLATVADLDALERSIIRLAADPALRKQMGQSARQSALETYDWQNILTQYTALAEHLNDMRLSATACNPEPWPTRADPFSRFAHFATDTLSASDELALRDITQRDDASARMHSQLQLSETLALSMTNYGFTPHGVNVENIMTVVAAFRQGGSLSVDSIQLKTGLSSQTLHKVLQWLIKFNVLHVKRRD